MIWFVVTNRDKSVHYQWLTDRFCALPRFCRKYRDQTMPYRYKIGHICTPPKRCDTVLYSTSTGPSIGLPYLNITSLNRTKPLPDQTAQHSTSWHYTMTGPDQMTLDVTSPRPDQTELYHYTTKPNGTIHYQGSTILVLTLRYHNTTLPNLTLPSLHKMAPYHYFNRIILYQPTLIFSMVT